MSDETGLLPIERAGEADIDAILELREQAAMWMADRGIHHWTANPCGEPWWNGGWKRGRLSLCAPAAAS